jgi:hypothetical protein
VVPVHVPELYGLGSVVVLIEFDVVEPVMCRLAPGPISISRRSNRSLLTMYGLGLDPDPDPEPEPGPLRLAGIASGDDCD